jgi:hypothetical protein
MKPARQKRAYLIIRKKPINPGLKFFLRCSSTKTSALAAEVFIYQ